jgi:hypothetical protein
MRTFIDDLSHPQVVGIAYGPAEEWGSLPLSLRTNVLIWLDENAPGWYCYRSVTGMVALSMSADQAFAFKMRWG